MTELSSELVPSKEPKHPKKNFKLPSPPQEDFSREVIFCMMAFVSIYAFISLISYSPLDPSWLSETIPPGKNNNWGGNIGSYGSGLFVFLLGVCSLLLPLPLPSMSYAYLRRKPFPFAKSRIAGWLMFILSLTALITKYFSYITIDSFPIPIGGLLGSVIHENLSWYLGSHGEQVFLFTGMFTGLILLSRKALIKESLLWLKHTTTKLLRRKNLKKNPIVASSDHTHATATPTDSLQQSLAAEQSLTADIPIKAQDPVGNADAVASTRKIPKVLEKMRRPQKVKPPSLPLVSPSTPEAQYTPPSATIFKTAGNQGQLSEEQQREFQETAAQLVKAFGEFGIQGKVIAIQPGPVVAVYEFQALAGTKLSKVTGLIEDIALALRVDSIFINPVSGKRALGIQVPNRKRETVFLGDIVSADNFKKSTSPLTFAMGKNLSGEPICEDLAKMPHLLVAGQTGSGKSVAINSLLCSIIMKSNPQEVKMVLVDPKILELKIYEGIPHLMMPVITEAPKASLALKWACYEMDRRYKLMELAKVRHISGFNSFWDSASRQDKDHIKTLAEQENIGRLPFIVIVIDELADLMLTAPKDVESSIQRLAQKARASGIHLVLATQRPSVDVITGVIKANLPCRLSFKVFSRGDSRTILDSMGAERLLGKGDMLFLKPGTSRLQRIQGAFLEDREVLEMVDSIKPQEEVTFDETAISWIEEEYERQSGTDSNVIDDSDGEDPKWDAAISIAQRQGAISASFLQRSLKIGYNRAARIVEHMESQGLIGAADGSKPRKWLGPN